MQSVAVQSVRKFWLWVIPAKLGEPAFAPSKEILAPVQMLPLQLPLPYWAEMEPPSHEPV